MKYTPQKRAYSINSAAEIIGAGRDGIYAAIRSGQLKARKFGRRTLILDKDLASFLQSLPDLGSSAVHSPANNVPKYRAHGEHVTKGSAA